MDDKVLSIGYYLVSLGLSIMMIRGTRDKSYRAICVLFVITFMYFIISYLDVIPRMGLEFITVTVAFVWYVAKRIRSRDEMLLVILPLVTAFRFVFKFLQLNGWNEVGLLCILVLIITVIYLLTYYFRKGTIGELKEAAELNGLFALALIPTLI